MHRMSLPLQAQKKALLNQNMKLKNQASQTLTLCDSAALRETNSYSHSSKVQKKVGISSKRMHLYCAIARDCWRQNLPDIRSHAEHGNEIARDCGVCLDRRAQLFFRNPCTVEPIRHALRN